MPYVWEGTSDQGQKVDMVFLQILDLLKFSGPVRNITFDVYDRSKNKIHSTFQSVFTVLTGTITIIGRVPLCNYPSVYLSFRFFLSFSLATGD